jgi:hypothetical protein
LFREAVEEHPPVRTPVKRPHWRVRRVLQRSGRPDRARRSVAGPSFEPADMRVHAESASGMLLSHTSPNCLCDVMWAGSPKAVSRPAETGSTVATKQRLWSKRMTERQHSVRGKTSSPHLTFNHVRFQTPPAGRQSSADCGLPPTARCRSARALQRATRRRPWPRRATYQIMQSWMCGTFNEQSSD